MYKEVCTLIANLGHTTRSLSSYSSQEECTKKWLQCNVPCTATTFSRHACSSLILKVKRIYFKLLQKLQYYGIKLTFLLYYSSLQCKLRCTAVCNLLLFTKPSCTAVHNAIYCALLCQLANSSHCFDSDTRTPHCHCCHHHCYHCQVDQIIRWSNNNWSKMSLELVWQCSWDGRWKLDQSVAVRRAARLSQPSNYWSHSSYSACTLTIAYCYCRLAPWLLLSFRPQDFPQDDQLIMPVHRNSALSNGGDSKLGHLTFDQNSTFFVFYFNDTAPSWINLTVQCTAMTDIPLRRNSLEFNIFRTIWLWAESSLSQEIGGQQPPGAKKPEIPSAGSWSPSQLRCHLTHCFTRITW